MTKELIIENCRRLIDFYKCNTNVYDLRFELTFKGLLDVYGWILDYNGAPVRNLSRLYLTDEAFNEMISEVYQMDIIVDRLYMTTSCCFLYNGYYWEIINQEEVKRNREELLAKIKNNQ
jgi:hypothetical protein